ncbi:double-strand-specific pac1 ribonuclease [Nannizzia gypsea CBS 118893]|uniref:Double-strand-specific pac1 ribonuclease n=1 Tax=Arthroderma gypseum (strain ATCC MYA-4604 / CBS 118893) TaxID=535722 RepID=E4UV31_ARTGP|nr:double-strand-specific pac1 ribonuclease [Nannizzia gypsea CBS 118893]EFR01148.1 double-strand-specific pac1 ribonuclease [Nannizzia gypsea CBS 118893]
MGTKRVSEAESSQNSSQNSKRIKKEKKGSQEKKHGETRTNGYSEDKLPVQFQLIQLQRLTQDLLAQSDNIETTEKENAKDLIKGLKRINKAFESSENTSTNHTKQLPLPHIPSDLPTPAVTPKDVKLPLLPPIGDEALKTAVFTHTGIMERGPISTQTSEKTYDRLEVLGDAYIELISTRLIWENFPTLPAGKIAQARETMVKNETLAEYAIAYGFDQRLKTSSDIRSVPKRWTKVMGDVFEAYVAAAIIADPKGGLQAVESWLTQLWLPKLAEVKVPLASVALAQGSKASLKDKLAATVMSRGIKLQYLDEKPRQREGGLVTSFIGVYLTGWGYEKKLLGSGSGLSKSEAGNEAALNALNNKPLIDQISAKKREYDQKMAAQKAAAAATSSAAETS